jgi:hypothetical protein
MFPYNARSFQLCIFVLVRTHQLYVNGPISAFMFARHDVPARAEWCMFSKIKLSSRYGKLHVLVDWQLMEIRVLEG